MKKTGRRSWLISGGHVPVESTGHEPEFTSNDLLCVLNASSKEAKIEVMVHYADRDPVGPYAFSVGARRVRRVRVNDLIDPEAVPLGVEYGLVIMSSVPVVVQFTRQDTRHAAVTVTGTLAFPLD